MAKYGIQLTKGTRYHYKDFKYLAVDPETGEDVVYKVDRELRDYLVEESGHFSDVAVGPDTTLVDPDTFVEDQKVKKRKKMVRKVVGPQAVSDNPEENSAEPQPIEEEEKSEEPKRRGRKPKRKSNIRISRKTEDEQEDNPLDIPEDEGDTEGSEPELV